MTRMILIVLFASSTCSAFCQETAPTGVKVVKSEAVEMKAVDPGAPPAEVVASAVALGDFTTAPAHPECGSLTDQARLDCTAQKVLAAIRAQVAQPVLDLKALGTSLVTVTFVVNQFGDVKDIQVEHPGDAGLNKAVTVALYGLPRMVAAAKGADDVISTLQLTYPYGELFTKP